MLDKTEWLFHIYRDLYSASKTETIRDIVDDIIKFYPELYESLETEFQRRSKIKLWGALLTDVNPTGRQTTRVAGSSRLERGPDRDEGDQGKP